VTDSREDPELVDELPRAKIERRRRGFPVVWIVPVVAAIVAGYLVYAHLQESGPTITIKFKDGHGIKAGQTEIRYRGVPIGEVTAIDLSEDEKYVLAKARLRRSASAIAKEGAEFWIVRPEVGFGTISGLSTVITGPYIQVLPGTGKPRTEFVGLEGAPPAERKGLRIILAANRLESVRPGSPVHYRGVEVGSVTSTELSRDATAAHIHLLISQRYARLVRVNSKFWSVSGVDVHVGLLRGLEISLESLRSLITGGIAFATPEDPSSRPATNGMIFTLYDKPQKEWLEWAPRISIPAAD